MMRIHKAISTLTAHTRLILEECYVRRKKYQEVADELNISVSAVRKHIVKALSVLRKEFAKKEYRGYLTILNKRIKISNRNKNNQ